MGLSIFIRAGQILPVRILSKTGDKIVGTANLKVIGFCPETSDLLCLQENELNKILHIVRTVKGDVISYNESYISFDYRDVDLQKELAFYPTINSFIKNDDKTDKKVSKTPV